MTEQKNPAHQAETEPMAIEPAHVMRREQHAEREAKAQKESK